MVLLVLLPGETRPTWAYPAHYTPALASSVLSVLWLLTRLAVRSARREPGERAAFPCSTTITEGWVRSALYTGSTGSRWVIAQNPTWLRAFWLKPVSLFGLSTLTVLASVHLVLAVSFCSSAFSESRLSGRLHCPEGFRPGAAARPAPASV